MPHRCMNCGRTYEDDSKELIDGCECGSSLFIYEEDDETVPEDEKARLKSDVEEMVEEGMKDKENIKFEFDLDSIIVEEEGVYTINVSKLLEEVPLVIKKEDEGYHIHLPSAFEPENRDFSPEDLE
ncbi:MAG: Zn-ribbon domain-containing protein [Candidatus Nanohaloarchaea archaeon]